MTNEEKNPDPELHKNSPLKNPLNPEPMALKERVPSNVLEALKIEAEGQKIGVSGLVNQIFERELLKLSYGGRKKESLAIFYSFFSPKVLRKIKARANELGMTRAELVRLVLERYVARESGEGV